MLENFVKKIKNLRFIFFFKCIILVCFLCLFGCNNKIEKQKNSKFNVVVTNFPIYDFVREISKGCNAYDFNLKMIIPPGVDSHSFEPTPADVELLENCDLLIYVGGPEDYWLENMLNSVDKKKGSRIKTLNLMKCLNLNEKSEKTDHHIWTGLSNSLKIIESIFNNLVFFDSKNAEFYRKNFELYKASIIKLKNEFHNVVSNSKRKVLVVADKFPFKYFIDEFNLEVKTPFVNCSSKSESSMSEIGRLVEFVKSNSIPIVIKIDGSNGEVAKIVSEETGVKVATFYVCHTISKSDFLANKSYLHFLKQNLEILKEALN